MSVRRRQTFSVQIGNVTIGGNAPVVVQSMTDTDTADIAKTVTQSKLLADAGSELVRLTVNTPKAAAAVPQIRARLDQLGCFVPLVGDFHYNGHVLLNEYPDCAKALAKYRINPGNVGFGDKKDVQFAAIIQCAIQNNKPVRIGVNWGSVDKSLLTQMMSSNAKLASPLSAQAVLRNALVTSALTSAEAAIKQGLGEDRIVVSCKVSLVQDLIAVYRMLAERCEYPLHLGLTEAGMGSQGIVASSVAMGVLLQEGIGDTIRTSLTPPKGASRDEEVRISQQILQTMGIREFSPLITSCPGCGRTTSTYFRELTEEINRFVKERMPIWRSRHQGVESMTLAVMGCVVNGPGESKYANIGISLPGTGEAPIAPVFVDGKKFTTLRGEGIAKEIKRIIENYVKEQYPLHDVTGSNAI